MSETIIDVGRDFSMTPGGRFKSEGRWSGEEFRSSMIEPHLNNGDSIIIDLDSAVGFTSGWLEEVFGGLVRRYGKGIERRVTVKASARPYRADRALRYMQRALDQTD